MNSYQYYIAFAGFWNLVNGILHDIFVLRQKRPYERELIRLLIDGHILIFSGILYFLAIFCNQPMDTIHFGICVINAVFMLGYCAFIFKMLPSAGTILVNGIALIWTIILFMHH